MTAALSTPTTLRRLVAVGLLILAGCGGGGSSTDTPAAAPPSTPPASGTPPAKATTALRDNRVGVGASFSNFAMATVRVPVDAASLTGTRRFVKLVNAAGETLFLGEVAPGQPFSIPVSVPLGQRTLRYEIFSESAQDPIIRGEVTA